MIPLYPSWLRYHCGGIAYATLLASGMAIWAGEWWWAGGFMGVTASVTLLDSFFGTREGL